MLDGRDDGKHNGIGSVEISKIFVIQIFFAIEPCEHSHQDSGNSILQWSIIGEVLSSGLTRQLVYAILRVIFMMEYSDVYLRVSASL